jgi:hypothetical protein
MALFDAAAYEAECRHAATLGTIADARELRRRLGTLGYRLASHKKDAFGRQWRYRTSPIAGGGGPTNYFRSADAVFAYVLRVEQIRSWQQ